MAPAEARELLALATGAARGTRPAPRSRSAGFAGSRPQGQPPPPAWGQATVLSQLRQTLSQVPPWLLVTLVVAFFLLLMF